MHKRIKKAPKKCNQHLFSLKPVPQQTHYNPLNLSLSFCSQPQLPETTAVCLQAPTFNTDASHASPAFTLPSDKNYYAERRQKMIKEHLLKFEKYTDQKSELNVAKPKSKNSYCSVCRQHYEDYLQHILGQLHKRKIAASSFNSYILQLANKFADSKAYPSSPLQTKTPIVIQEVIDDSDQVEIISNPYLKNKKTDCSTGKEQTALSSTSRTQPIHLNTRQIIPSPHIRQEININNQPFSSLYPFPQVNNFPTEMHHPPMEWANSLRINNSFPQFNPFSFNYNLNFMFNPYGYLSPLSFGDMRISTPWMVGDQAEIMRINHNRV